MPINLFDTGCPMYGGYGSQIFIWALWILIPIALILLITWLIKQIMV